MLPRIAIIDDDADSRETFASSARRAGFDPKIFAKRYRTIDELLGEARSSKVNYALCDHRLNEKPYARFYGAEAVASFYDAGIPAVLVTSYQRSDTETSIRPFRRRIPRLLSTVNVPALRDALTACKAEIIDHELPLERRGHRAVLTVKELVSKQHDTVVRVKITQWNISELAGFPLSMVPSALQKSVEPGAFLFATVNTAAASAEDLFFEDFELPHPEDVQAVRAQFNNP